MAHKNRDVILQEMYKQQPLAFRQRCADKLSKYKEDIVAKNEITETKFVDNLTGKMSSSLSKIAFQMIYATKEMNTQQNDEGLIKTVNKSDIERFVSNNCSTAVATKLTKVTKPNQKSKKDSKEDIIFLAFSLPLIWAKMWAKIKNVK